MTGAILLAAGRSRRFGAANKLTTEIAGKPLVARAVEPLLECGLSPVIAVLGFEAARVRKALAAYDVDCVENENFDGGMGESIARGMAALAGTDCAAVFIALGDMPGLDGATVRALMAARAASPGGIVAPTLGGRRGHPALFSRPFYAALAACSGDRGAASVIAANAQSVTLVPVADPGIHRDIDSPGDLEPPG